MNDNGTSKSLTVPVKDLAATAKAIQDQDDALREINTNLNAVNSHLHKFVGVEQQLADSLVGLQGQLSKLDEHGQTAAKTVADAGERAGTGLRADVSRTTAEINKLVAGMYRDIEKSASEAAAKLAQAATAADSFFDDRLKQLELQTSELHSAVTDVADFLARLPQLVAAEIDAGIVRFRADENRARKRESAGAPALQSADRDPRSDGL